MRRSLLYTVSWAAGTRWVGCLQAEDEVGVVDLGQGGAVLLQAVGGGHLRARKMFVRLMQVTGRI